jgi:3-dehydroquinate synthase
LKEYHSKEFRIFIGNDVFDTLLQQLIEEAYSQVFVLVDEQTEKYCLTILSKYLLNYNTIRIPSGEAYKSLSVAENIWKELFKNEADKKSVIINLGGGVVGDIGGFCASIYKRGIDYIQVPTTLLAMVDSSIGGKTAIDFEGTKNVIGTIKQPKSIYIYPDFLATLPKSEILNGYAEMIKHGLIADKDYWQKLKSIQFDEWAKLVTLINGSVKIKLDIIKKDPYELAERKILNFGHTIAHAIEAYSLKNDKKPISHGEAVAIGIICETYLSKTALDFSNKDLKQITDIISKSFPKYSLRSILSPELIKYMRHDKKNAYEQIQFALIKKIGKAVYNVNCSDLEITAALNYYDAL